RHDLRARRHPGLRPAGGQDTCWLRGGRCHSESDRRTVTHLRSPQGASSFGEASPPITADQSGLMTWWHEADVTARRAFIAASLGWMLDSFDVMLYAIVLA